MKTTRKGMGFGRGSGYYNLIKGYDSYVHSLSARGYRTMANNNLLYKTLPKSVPMPKLQLLSAKQFDSKFKDDYKEDEQGYATTRVNPDGKATIYVRDSGDIERTGKLIAHELNELAIFDHLVNDEGVDSQQAQVLAHNLNAVKVEGVDDTYELNAKGIKDYKKYDIYKLERWAENADDEERGSHLVSEEFHIVPEDKKDEFGEWMADEYGYQDYSNKIQLVKLGGNITGEELKEIYKQYKEQQKRKKEKEKINIKDW